jgi:hypothetical protein
MRSPNSLVSEALVVFPCLLLSLGTLVGQQEDRAQQLIDKIATKLAAMPLQRLKESGVLVEGLSEEAIRGGLNERKLQREVEAKLRSIGLRIVDSHTAQPYMYINVLASRISTIYVFTITLELHEQVIPVRDQSMLYGGTTWHRAVQSTAAQDGLPPKVIEGLSLLLNEFKEAYLLVNEQ